VTWVFIGGGLMANNSFEKDPQAVLDYKVDWSDWLTDGETITTSTWTVPSGITEDSDTHDDDSATIWLSGGTAGKRYTVINHIVTTAGREDDRSIVISVKNR